MKSSIWFCIVHACASLVAFSHTAIAADSSAYGQSVAAQRDGKIVVAGCAAVGRAAQVALVRYNADGSLDTSFNGSGKLTSAVGAGDCHREGVALQSDGKIVVAGDSFNAGGYSTFTALRYRGRKPRHKLRRLRQGNNQCWRQERRCRERDDAERRKDCRRRLVQRQQQ